MSDATFALRGMAWDHPRARDPLAAISAEWTRHTGIDVHWDARPLKDFEDQPLEELATRYDLMLIDHPFVATAASSGLVAPVQAWAHPAYLDDQRAGSVGPSYRSYTWEDKQWALAVDAACQVAAVREDLWKATIGGALPATWDDVAELAVELGSSPTRVAMPLNPNHAYCAFLSVGLCNAGPGFWHETKGIDAPAAVEALELLQGLTRNLHPSSRSDDPIGISDTMAQTDEILYVPLMFGYSSYARAQFRSHRLAFHNAPRGADGRAGSVLGGVGLALSARSRNLEAAASLAREIASPAVQSGTYVRCGGQPGHGAAWDSPEANSLTGDFFLATRRTIEEAFMRPRLPGHRRFQPEAGALIHDCIWDGGMTPKQCAAAFAKLAADLLTRH
jgi:multiple sugar transport system substrate-binding protein